MTRTKQTPFWLTALNWLADRDAAYRQARCLMTQTDERLADMGMTRAEADRAFEARPQRAAPFAMPVAARV